MGDMEWIKAGTKKCRLLELLLVPPPDAPIRMGSQMRNEERG